MRSNRSSRRRPPSPRRPKRVVHVERSPSGSTGRYTPPAKRVRARPTWHRVAGTVEVVLGVALIVVNYIQYEVPILPGGHSELYFVAGLLIVGGSLWWFGAFDRSR